MHERDTSRPKNSFIEGEKRVARKEKGKKAAYKGYLQGRSAI